MMLWVMVSWYLGMVTPWHHPGTGQGSEIDFRQRRGQLPILRGTRIAVAQKQVVEPILHHRVPWGKVVSDNHGMPWDGDLYVDWCRDKELELQTT